MLTKVSPLGSAGSPGYREKLCFERRTCAASSLGPTSARSVPAHVAAGGAGHAASCSDLRWSQDWDAIHLQLTVAQASQEEERALATPTAGGQAETVNHAADLLAVSLHNSARQPQDLG